MFNTIKEKVIQPRMARKDTFIKNVRVLYSLKIRIENSHFIYNKRSIGRSERLFYKWVDI